MDWKDNPTEFSYKRALNGESEIQTIREVVEFGIPSQFKYVRFDVLIDKSSDQIEHLSHTRKAIFEKERLFLKVLVEGQASLYSYRKINLIRYFYSTDTIAIEQLVYKQYRVEDKNTILKNEKFRYQLKFNLPCNPSTDLLAENTNYREKDLIKYFIEFNSCKGEYYSVFDNDEEKDLFNLNLRPGIQFSTLSVSSSLTSLYDVQFETETGFRIGIETEFILPFNNGKWAIITEPTYQYYRSEGHTSSQNVKIDYQSLEIPIGLRHYFHLYQDTKLFINGLVVFDLPVNSSIAWESIPDQPLELSTNLALGVGYKYNERLGLEMRYGFKRNILNRYLNWGANYNGLSVVLSYTI
ncbi:outer membrane beta-barrel protein [bacterium SCSIO 12643]|nr:outer membrane beta-barrel protein [bacterium SCSIO 12643]